MVSLNYLYNKLNAKMTKVQKRIFARTIRQRTNDTSIKIGDEPSTVCRKAKKYLKAHQQHHRKRTRKSSPLVAQTHRRLRHVHEQSNGDSVDSGLMGIITMALIAAGCLWLMPKGSSSGSSSSSSGSSSSGSSSGSSSSGSSSLSLPLSNRSTAFTQEQLNTLKRNNSFVPGKEHADLLEYDTAGDGNCGYFAVMQGLIEHYCVMGHNNSNTRLKQLMTDIKSYHAINAALQNKNKKLITFKRDIINCLRLSLCDIYQFWGDAWGNDYRNIIRNIKEGIKTVEQCSFLPQKTWINERDLRMITDGYDVPIIMYNTEGVDDYESATAYASNSHTIILATNGAHFQYYSTNLNNYERKVNASLRRCSNKNFL